MSDLIKINGGAAGQSNYALADGATVAFSVDGTFTTYAWSLVFSPEDARGVDPEPSFSAPSGATTNLTLTAGYNGLSWLIRLVVDAGLNTEDSDYVVVAVPHASKGWIIPPVGATRQMTDLTYSWGNFTHGLGKILYDLMTDAGGNDTREFTVVVGNDLEGDLAGSCDYLDPGDGSGIAAACTYMYGKRGRIQVRRGAYVRPSGATVITIPTGVSLVGEGRGQTVITAPALDASSIPWCTFAMGGADSALTDMTITLPARGASVATPATAVGVVSTQSPLCRVARVNFVIGTAVTAWSTPVAMLEFPAGSTYGHDIDTVSLDMTNAVVTGNASNQHAFLFASSGFTLATSARTPVDPFLSYPETVFRNCSVVGGKCNSTGTAYYMYAYGMQAMSYFSVVGGSYEGMRSFMRGDWQSATAGLEVFGPSFRDVLLVGSTGIAASGASATTGDITLSLTGAGTLVMRRLEYVNVRFTGPATNGHNGNLIIRPQAVTLYGLRVRANTLDSRSATGQGASITVTGTLSGSIAAPEVSDNTLLNSGANAGTYGVNVTASGTCTVPRAKIRGNTSVDLSVQGANVTNATVSDNTYSGTLTDTATATSYSNNQNV